MRRTPNESPHVRRQKLDGMRAGFPFLLVHSAASVVVCN